MVLMAYSIISEEIGERSGGWVTEPNSSDIVGPKDENAALVDTGLNAHTRRNDRFRSFVRTVGLQKTE